MHACCQKEDDTYSPLEWKPVSTLLVKQIWERFPIRFPSAEDDSIFWTTNPLQRTALFVFVILRENRFLEYLLHEYMIRTDICINCRH